MEDYKVVDGKKIEGAKTLQHSRFFSSMPDICIYHQTMHHGVVIHYEDDTHDKQEEEEEELLYGY